MLLAWYSESLGGRRERDINLDEKQRPVSLLEMKSFSVSEIS